MPFDPDQYLRDKHQQSKQQFDPDEYVRMHPDPDRGAIQKWGDVGTGLWRGLAGQAGTSGRILEQVPPEIAGAIPMVGPIARGVGELSRSPVGAAVRKFADQPDASWQEKAGHVAGSVLGPPTGGGARAAELGISGLTRIAPHLAQIYALFAHPLETIAARDAGVWPKLHEIARAAAPFLGQYVGRPIGNVAERAGLAGAGAAVAPEDPDALPQTQTPTPTQAPAPAPARGQDRPRAPRPMPQEYPDTDAPVANRSSRGDRLPLYRPPTN